MKILKSSFSVILMLVFAVGCKKNDLANELAEAHAEIETTSLQTSNSVTDSTVWQSSAEWQAANQEDFSVFYININDKAITPDVIDNGMVLVFKKDGASIVALPFEDNIKANSKYWYHQVTEGELLISVDSYGAATAPTTSNSFKYFIITPEKLKALEANGQPADNLMNLSFEEVSELF